MPNNKQKQQDAYGHTRKTILFNERTDRSLNAELSQIERNRQKVLRDLNKIKQVKSALSDQLKSAKGNIHQRSKSDSSAVENNRFFPKINTMGSYLKHDVDQPRTRRLSDTGLSGQLVTKVIEKADFGWRNHNEAKGEFGNKSLSYVSLEKKRFVQIPAISVEHEDQAHGNETEMNHHNYETNQEKREDIMIQSRFNQLGSKYIGKELMGKKRKQELSSRTRRFKDGMLPERNRKQQRFDISSKSDGIIDKNVAGVKNKKRLLEEESEHTIATQMSGLAIIKSEDSQNQEEQLSSIATAHTMNEKYDAVSKNIIDTGKPSVSKRSEARSETRSENRFDLKPENRRQSLTIKQGKLSKPKISPISTGSDTDWKLPKVPFELTSCRHTRKGESIEQAFISCRDVNAERKDLKTERKRRFSRLVDMMIKQRMVIHAWEPMLAMVGDINSSDEEEFV